MLLRKSSLRHFFSQSMICVLTVLSGRRHWFAGSIRKRDCFLRGFLFRVTKNRQTPIFETHVTKTSAPRQTAKKEAPQQEKIEKPTSKQEGSTSDENAEEQTAQNLLNKIATIYDYLTDTSINEEDRIEVEQRFTQTYSDEISEVKVLSQDNDFVIDRSSFEDFNGRVATSRLLRKIAICGYLKGTNGKIALVVKEIYKK